MHHLPTRTVTLLFTDIEVSTRQPQQVVDHYTNLLEECRQLLRASFQQWNGNVMNTYGAAFSVVFARTTTAVSAAAAAQRALVSHLWPEGVVVRVRMSIHTGEPTLSAENYFGLDIHHVRCMMSAGHAGQVLLSQTTHDLVEHDLPDDVSLRDLGAHRLKDLQHPSHLFQLVIAGLPADFPPLKTLDTHPNNLPTQLTSLIGREEEIATVEHQLSREEVHLLTLTGPGGVGKTRLALQVAAELSDRFVDGVFFVNLAPLSNSALVVPTIAYTLGLREGGDWPLLERLHTYLRDKQMLLLLDNFEHVVSAALRLVELLADCPKLKALVTSRAMLRVRGEYEFPVAPLTLPDPEHVPEESVTLSQYSAVALFMQRAQVIQPDFQLTAVNAHAIAEVCMHLDGLPLAIELAAARIKLLPPPVLLERLKHRLDVLTRAPQDLPARQQTLRNTLAWSYDLLTTEEQQLFRRLSVFVGGCTLEAAENVCAALGESTDTRAFSVLDGVASLIDKSLLHRKGQGEQEPRLVLLETVREYGLECLRTSGEVTTAQRTHAAYYLALVRTAEPKLTGVEQGRWLDRLEQEHENLRAALQWLEEQNEIEAALRFARALWIFWWTRGYLKEGRIVLEQLLRSAEGVAVTVRARALHAAGALAVFQGDVERAKELCGESLNLFRASGNAYGVSASLETLGYVAMTRSEYGLARALLEESLTLHRGMKAILNSKHALAILAEVALEQGEYEEARNLTEESLHLFREAGDMWGISHTLTLLAVVLYLQGDLTEAHQLCEESLALSRAVGAKMESAYTLLFLGCTVFFQGQYASARSLIEEALALQIEMGSRRGIALGLQGLGVLTLFQDDHVTARTLYEECLALCRKINYLWLIPSSLEGLAMVAFTQGDPAWAARLWGAADALRDALGAPLPPVYHADYSRTVVAARTQLGEKAFAALWAEGHAMTPEQALTTQGRVTKPRPAPAEPLLTSPTKSPPIYPARLTDREVEVLRLVASGMTDAQVAEQLFISPHTVNTHVKSIYGKIGVTSRSAATRYAMEHRLV